MIRNAKNLLDLGVPAGGRDSQDEVEPGITAVFGILFHHGSSLRDFPLRQAPVVYAAREGFGAACRVLVQYQAWYDPIKKLHDSVINIFGHVVHSKFELNRQMSTRLVEFLVRLHCTWQFSQEPSDSGALESNGDSMSVGCRVFGAFWMLVSTILCFTQFQYMWLTYTGTIAFILVTSCF